MSVDDANMHFSVDGCALYGSSGRVLVRLFGDIGRFIVPRRVEVLGSHCFSEYRLLSEIIFEDDSELKLIDECAFWGSGIRSIRIPRKVEIIGGNCFYVCSFLSEVVFEEGSELRRIGDRAFKFSGLSPNSIEAGLSGIESITIRVPAGVEVGEDLGCRIIRIPDEKQ